MPVRVARFFDRKRSIVQSTHRYDTPMPLSPAAAREPIAQAVLKQLAQVAQRCTLALVVRLHLPCQSPTGQLHDAEFCAIELADGGFGLSYALLGDTLHFLPHHHRSGVPLAGVNPMALARRLMGGGSMERALALAAINAMTGAAWRRVG